MELKGITWDHERGVDPLLPVSDLFCKTHPDVTISWAKRSLKDFGDYPISKLAEHYDMIMIDHPFMAEALREDLLVVLNDHLSENYLTTLSNDAVGLSLDSYCVDGSYLGLPVDAAAQVAAANMEVIDRLGVQIPRSFQDVLALKEQIGNYYIGAAMAPTDIFSTYFGLVAQLSGKTYFDMTKGIALDKGEEAAKLLFQLADAAHPDTFEMNPIQILDAMSSAGEIIYTPYVYGYTNYSRKDFRKHLLTFWDAPLIRETALVSTQLGGVGISLTKHLKPENLDTAVQFAEFLASPEIQRGIYTEANGQPAARSAWMDERNNELTCNFFKNTIKTLDTAFLRPKIAYWNSFQEEAGNVLHSQVKQRISPRKIAETFNHLYVDICLK